jgi:large subunit ribosomal protein L2
MLVRRMLRPGLAAHAHLRLNCLASSSSLTSSLSHGLATSLSISSISSRGFASVIPVIRKVSDRIRTFKPHTPSLRHRVDIINDHLWKGRPVKALTTGLRKRGGRNNQGKMVIKGRGGGHKRLYRHIDFKRSVLDEPAIVQRFEYDPNRNAHIALLMYGDGNVSYIIAPDGSQIGDSIVASRTQELEVKVGNCMPLRNIPLGVEIHCLELTPGKGAQIQRSAGTYAVVMDKGSRKEHATVRLSSKEERYIHLDCMATIGGVSNPLFKMRKLGKAGRNRWLGRRPKVRGVAMNPVDHPHGGGEGKGKGRLSTSVTGVLAKGFRTRKKRPHNNIIVERYGKRNKQNIGDVKMKKK